MKYKKKTKLALWTQFAGKKKVDQRAADKKRYNERVKEWLAGKKCVGCFLGAIAGCEVRLKPATQCHHKHGRGNLGELLLAEDLWIPVCGNCHRWIHANIEAARALGLYAPRGQWNRKPPKRLENTVQTDA